MRAGDVIDGKYRVEVELGQGGMGRVFAASHMAIGNTVALKVLRPEAMSSPEVSKRFIREARAAGRLRSEHVVRVHDVGALPTGEPYMVMEMLHGQDLASRLQVGPIPPAQAVEYIVQACEGLAEAHALGMVHRDVKPANIYVTARPNGQALVKVLDFGIATAATGDIDPRLTATQSVMGSPSYMSPEQLKGARDVDARSDIWSLGVTLYEIISGHQPFVGPTLTALSLSIVTDPHQRLAGCPDALIEIIDRCLEKNPAHRFQNVAELARALSPLFTGGVIAADMVAGSYSQPVPPTLMGLERSMTTGTEPTQAPMIRPRVTAAPSTSAHVGMTSTTSLASGETGTSMPARGGRKWMWITAGIATVALGIGVGVVVGMGGPEKNAAAAKTEPPPVKADPPPPPKIEPKVEPIQEPPPPPPVEPKTVDAPKQPDPPPVKKPPVAVVKKTPVKTPVKKPPDKRNPVEPPDYTKDPGKDPNKTTKPPDPDPVKEPVKVKPPSGCAPNDPRCGL